MIRHDDITKQLKSMFFAGRIQMLNEQVPRVNILQTGQMTIATESDKAGCSRVIVMSEFDHDRNDKLAERRAQGFSVPTIISHSQRTRCLYG
jgi:hypothetical protein